MQLRCNSLMQSTMGISMGASITPHLVCSRHRTWPMKRWLSRLNNSNTNNNWWCSSSNNNKIRLTFSGILSSQLSLSSVCLTRAVGNPWTSICTNSNSMPSLSKTPWFSTITINNRTWWLNHLSTRSIKCSSRSLALHSRRAMQSKSQRVRNHWLNSSQTSQSHWVNR